MTPLKGISDNKRHLNHCWWPIRARENRPADQLSGFK